MESAASLFGNGDVSSDPFASLGAQETPLESSQDTTNTRGQGPTKDVDANGSNFFDENSSQSVFCNGEYETTQTQEHYSYPSSQQPVHQPQYDGFPQQTHEAALANGLIYQNESSKYTPTAAVPAANPYELKQNVYAPTSNSAYQPSSYATRTTYDGLPSTTQTYQSPTYSTYTPNGGSNPQYGYGRTNYNPTYPTQQASPAPPPAATTFSVPPPTTSTVKTVVRPKVANAYDPPIPPSRQSRRPMARAPSGQTCGFNGYETQLAGPVGSSTPPVSHQNPMPPPPPRPPQSTFSPTPPPTQALLPPLPPVTNQALYGAHSGPYTSNNNHLSYPTPKTNGEIESSAHENGSSPSQGPINEASDDYIASQRVSDGFYDDTAVTSAPAASWVAVEDRLKNVEQNQGADTISDVPSVNTADQLGTSISETLPEQLGHTLTSATFSTPSAQLLDTAVELSLSEAVHERPANNNMELPSPPNSYAPPRTMSPASASREAPPPVDLYTPTFRPSATTSHDNHPSADPYAPTRAPMPNGYRTSSPLSTNRVNGINHSHEKYISPPSLHGPPRRVDRNRSMSGSSLLSNNSSCAEDPYAPSRQSQTLNNSGNLGHFRHSSPVPHRGNTPDFASPQELSVKPTFQSHYAPSPSLLGANDPLGRVSARVPVFSFGFGGKFITCFHGANTVNTGFDVALSSRNTTGIRIRNLKIIIPEAQQDALTSFPGPLFGDPGSQSTSLVRTGPNTYMKNKKTQILKYLNDRATELELGLRYFELDSLAYGRANGKLILTKLLKVMVEHDGRLTGSPEIDNAVRVALVPSLENTSEPSTFVTLSDTPSAFGYPSMAGSANASGQEISTTTLKSSHLEQLEDFLMRGERKKAYHYALDERLWAHAMVIASSIDKDAWKEVVSEFLKGELGSNPSETASSSGTGRESLRVVYGLYSGQGPSAIQEFSPQNLLLKGGNQLQPSTLPTASQITPRTPNFGNPAPCTLTLKSLVKWPETIAMMLSSPLPTETAAALTALGDQLVSVQLYEAGHVCYLLSPQTSPFGGVGQPAARLILVGSRSPQSWPLFMKDPDPFIFTEIVEFALSLAPVAKGQDPFSGIAHLQAYRFIRAISLIDMGEVQQANRYCEAIMGTLSRVSPYTAPVLLDQLRELSDRIAGTTQVDKSFWSGGKISKPSLDTIGGWLEGRFTRLVTGDEERTPNDEKKTEGKDFSGPFSHYSTISSNTPSARSSPQPTHINTHTLPPPARSGSAMAHASPYQYQPVDRASSAMDHVRRKSTPQPQPQATPASSTATSFYTTPSSGPWQPQDNLVTPRPPPVGEEETQESGGWWSSTGYDEGPATKTPTTATFMTVDQGLTDAQPTDGFISLMDNHSYSVGPSRPSSEVSYRSPISTYEDDEDDLGLGNSKPKLRKAETSDTIKPEPKAEEAPKAASTQSTENKPDLQQTGSWFSRWWKKGDAPQPVKANLGEQSSFYYDQDLKRWVNKNTPPEPAKPAAPPPPPSRAQTASPGMTGYHPPISPGGTPPPPPARAASAIDLSTSPPSRTVMRVRSNLVPSGAPESAPSTPTGSRLAPAGPPPGRPRSQASKRNMRNRYVDVFQQEITSGGA